MKKIMKGVFFLFLLSLFVANPSYAKESQTIGEQYRVISHARKFNNFWNKVHSFDDEKRYQVFKNSSFNQGDRLVYDDLAFNAKIDPDWETNKPRIVQSILKQHDRAHSAIMKLQKQVVRKLPGLVEETLKKYSFKNMIDIIITPLFTSGGTVRVYGNTVLLVIGSNVLQATSALWEMIVPHELTHAYNIVHSDYPGGDDIKEWLSPKAKLYWRLWTEGLATYGAYYVLENTSLDIIMGYKEYGQFAFDENPYIDKKLAQLFIPVMDKRFLDFQNPETQKRINNWFGRRSTVLGNKTPPAPGYYLGFRIIKTIVDSGRYSFKDLLALSTNDTRKLILETLTMLVQ